MTVMVQELVLLSVPDFRTDSFEGVFMVCCKMIERWNYVWKRRTIWMTSLVLHLNLYFLLLLPGPRITCFTVFLVPLVQCVSPCDLPRVDLVNLSYFRAHLSDSLILYNTLCIFLSLALFFVCWLGMDCSCSSEIANIKLSMIKMCFRMRGWFQNVLKVINFIINDHIFCISVYHLHTLHCCLFLLYESCFYNGACFSGEPLLNIWCCLWNIM